jgi:hypothetical protein
MAAVASDQMGRPHVRQWYRDADGDGYGNPHAQLLSRVKPARFVADNTDCDDARADVHPGADEQPSSGLDDDCDGTLAVSSPHQLAVWEAVGDRGDARLGATIAAGSDFDGDGNADLALGGALVDVAVGLRHGLVRIHSGPLSETGSPVGGDSATATLYGSGDDQESRISGVGDLDGDGADDLVIGHNSPGGNSGVIYLLRGPFAGEVDTTTDGQVFYGDGLSAELAYSAGPGDVDGDGAPDVVIGSAQYGGDQPGGGIAYLLRGPAEQTSLDDADMKLVAEAEQERIGSAVGALGDITGDGLQDFSVSNGSADSTVVDGSAVYLVTEYLAGAAHPREVGVTVHTGWGGLPRGFTSKVGDINDDGYDDVAVAPGNYHGSQALSVLEGPFGEEDELTLESDSTIVFGSSAGGPDRGLAFATALGDWNGDGQGVLAIADPAFAPDWAQARHDCNNSVCDQGAIYLMAEPIEPGSYDLATTADRIEGTYNSGFLGGGMLPAAPGGYDLSGDGLPDFAFAAYYADGVTGDRGGHVYVLFGGGD